LDGWMCVSFECLSVCLSAVVGSTRNAHNSGVTGVEALRYGVGLARVLATQCTTVKSDVFEKVVEYG
jgi:hypothetical protein